MLWVPPAQQECHTSPHTPESGASCFHSFPIARTPFLTQQSLALVLGCSGFISLIPRDLACLSPAVPFPSVHFPKSCAFPAPRNASGDTWCSCFLLPHTWLVCLCPAGCVRLQRHLAHVSWAPGTQTPLIKSAFEAQDVGFPFDDWAYNSSN